MMELAGGYQIGDRVFVGGALGTVLGPPARQIAARLSQASEPGKRVRGEGSPLGLSKFLPML